MSASYGTIEVVRGRLSQESADELVRFWSEEGVLDEAAARARLAEVVCVLRGPDGRLAGVNSVYPAELGLVGGRRFWVYRNYMSEGTGAALGDMAQRAFLALQAEFDPAVEGPIGICYLLAYETAKATLPLVNSIYPASRYVGYLDDERQVRIRYFDGARVGPPRDVAMPALPLDHPYRIVPFAEQGVIGAADVIAFWEREGAMLEEGEAERRIAEVQVVGTLADGQLAAVGTAYLKHNEQLGLDLWYYREFVAEAHRATRLGWAMSLVARDYLRHRYIGGVDTRASGILYEVENEGLKEFMDYGVWPTADFLFIGENSRGDHVRVHYFPGVAAPRPAK
jgi:hypothetical protein